MNGSKDTVTIASAVVGGVVGYLMFTDAGQTMRRQMAPAVRDVSREFTNLQRTMRRAAEGPLGRSSGRFEGRSYVR